MVSEGIGAVRGYVVGRCLLRGGRVELAAEVRQMIAYSYMRERRVVEMSARRANVAAALCFVGLLGAVILERLA